MTLSPSVGRRLVRVSHNIALAVAADGALRMPFLRKAADGDKANIDRNCSFSGAIMERIALWKRREMACEVTSDEIEPRN